MEGPQGADEITLTYLPNNVNLFLGAGVTWLI